MGGYNLNLGGEQPPEPRKSKFNLGIGDEPKSKFDLGLPREAKNPLTESISKGVAGWGESYEKAMPAHVSWIEDHLPDSLKKSYKDYTAQFLAHVGKAGPEMANFASSPMGIALAIGHIIPQTRPLAGLIDIGLGLHQAVQGAQSVNKARLDPSPENTARAFVDVATAAGFALGGEKMRKAKPVAETAAKATPRAKIATVGSELGAATREGLEKFAGVTKEQEVRGIGEQTIRHRRGTLDREMAQAQQGLRSEYLRMEGLSQPEKLEFVDRLEQAPTRAEVKQPNPVNQPLSDKLGQMLDTEWDKIISLKIPGLDRHFYETYFPHLWKDPERAAKVMGDWYSKKPLAGSQSFRKHRIHPTMADGRAAGLIPLSDNPVEMTLLKLKELKNFRSATESLNDLKSRGLAKRFRSSTIQKLPTGSTNTVYHKLPEGWSRIKDPLFQIGPRGLAGDWIVPEPIARSFSNYLSPGLSRTLREGLPFGSVAAKATDLAGWYNVNSNMMNVAFSGFHIALETGLSMLNEISLGLKKAAAGKYKDAGGSLAASFGWAPIRDFFKTGKEFREEYYTPGTHPSISPIVEAYEKGGGRFRTEPLLRQDLSYRSRLIDKMFDHWQAQAKGSGMEAIPRAMRYTFDFTMQEFVPRMKAAAFARMAEFEMERLGANSTLDAQRKVFSRLVDAVDDRHGQLTYDNIFLPKVWKDAGFLSTRFLGWTIGTLRAGTGGVLDIARQPVRAMLGHGAEFTQRAAWIMALPFSFGLMNGVYQMLMTGKPPTSMRDLVAPQNGRKRQDGTPDRDVLPFTAYLKDYYEWATRLPTTAEHKLSNAIITMWDLFVRNADILDREIWNQESGVPENVLSVMKFLIGQSEPISFQTLEQQYGEGQVSGPAAVARSVLGIREAPAYMTRSAAQNKILDFTAPRMPRGLFPVEDFERRDESKRLFEGLLSGALSQKDVNESFRAGKITVRDRSTILRGILTEPWARTGIWGKRFITLTPNQALIVFRMADTDEKRKMLPLMNHHLAKAAQDQNVERRDRVREQIKKEMDAVRGESVPPEARYSLGL